ncbi:MAG: hypothetical protein HEQ32_02220 [Vampirovibrio sp.]
MGFSLSQRQVPSLSSLSWGATLYPSPRWAPANQTRHASPAPSLHDTIQARRQGYFYTYLFMPATRAKNSRVALFLDQGLAPLLKSPLCIRYLEEAGFPEVRQNPQALRQAQDILNDACLVLSVNNVQRNTSYPNRLYRLSADMTAYLNDRPKEMKILGLNGISEYDAERFQRLASKLLWSVGIQETYLSRQEQDDLLRMLIDASQAPLRLNLWFKPLS